MWFYHGTEIRIRNIAFKADIILPTPGGYTSSLERDPKSVKTTCQNLVKSQTSISRASRDEQIWDRW